MKSYLKFSEIGQTKNGSFYVGFYENEAFHASSATQSIIPKMWFFDYKGGRYSVSETDKKIISCRR